MTAPLLLHRRLLEPVLVGDGDDPLAAEPVMAVDELNEIQVVDQAQDTAAYELAAVVGHPIEVATLEVSLSKKKTS